MKITSTKDLESIQKEFSNKIYYPEAVKVNIGMASCGIAAGAQIALEKAIQEYSGDNGIQVGQTGCIGFCEEEPLVEILAPGKPRVMYKKITEDKILDVLGDYTEGTFKKKWILGQMRDPRSLLEDGIQNPVADVEPVEAAIAIDGYRILNETSFRIGDYEALKEAFLDPYAALRDAYIQNRRKKVAE